MLPALRGDAETAEILLAALRDMRASEDPQEQALISMVEAFTAAARRQPADALRHARAVLTHAEPLGISAVALRWAWPLAARSAHELGDTAAVRDLLAVLDSYQPGYLARMLQAEGDLARARLPDGDRAVDGDAAGAFIAAIASLRNQSTPYHLAHGLLDHAAWLTTDGDPQAAATAVSEATAIAAKLGCQPLLDRAASLAPATAPLTN